MDTLPLGSRAQFLQDPLGQQFPAYRATLPVVVDEWVRSRREVVRISTYRHPSGIDQKEAHPEKEQYEPGRYTVSFRNVAEKERHIEELKAQAVDEDLGIWDWQQVLAEQVVKQLSLTPPTRYSATLNPEILEWVKSRDEVINIEPDPMTRYETPVRRKGWKGLMDWILNVPAKF
ncbi:hypothetical protein C8R47DRAFT_1227100 [Mycena vitilis]|nr:hypothetical protein C8R47DRAFT_1227100 [Mycena vitilis]